jgi:hypothetical protein
VLAITQNAPVWAAIFVWELARPPWWMLIVFAAAALGAHLVGRISREMTHHSAFSQLASDRPVVKE